MKKVIHYDASQVGRLRCDSCEYHAPEPEPFSVLMIGRPCPECGANLLTRRDYAKTMRLLKLIDRINAFFAWFGIGKEAPSKEDLKHTVKARYVRGKLIVEEDKGS